VDSKSDSHLGKGDEWSDGSRHLEREYELYVNDLLKACMSDYCN